MSACGQKNVVGEKVGEKMRAKSDRIVAASAQDSDHFLHALKIHVVHSDALRKFGCKIDDFRSPGNIK